MRKEERNRRSNVANVRSVCLERRRLHQPSDRATRSCSPHFYYRFRAVPTRVASPPTDKTTTWNSRVERVSAENIYIYIYIPGTLLFAAPFEMDNRVEIGKVRDETCSSRSNRWRNGNRRNRVRVRKGECVESWRTDKTSRYIRRGDTTHGSSQSVAASFARRGSTYDYPFPTGTESTEEKLRGDDATRREVEEGGGVGCRDAVISCHAVVVLSSCPISKYHSVMQRDGGLLL